MSEKEYVILWACILVVTVIIFVAMLTFIRPSLDILDAQHVCESRGWDYAYINRDSHVYCGADASNEEGNGTGIVIGVSLESVMAAPPLP